MQALSRFLSLVLKLTFTFQIFLEPTIIIRSPFRVVLPNLYLITSSASTKSTNYVIHGPDGKHFHPFMPGNELLLTPFCLLYRI